MFYRHHNRYLTPVGTVSMTKQSHKDECDINLILKQYQRTGIITHIQAQQPSFQDLPDTQDYQESLNTIMRGEDAFAALPAKVRDHFQNDPAKFLEAFGDPKQADYLREVGLLNPLPPPPADVQPPTPTE